MNKGNYPLEALKKKILSSGYTQKDIDDALTQLNLDSKKTVPTVSATINKINRTNLVEKKLESSKPVVQKSVKAKKSRKLLWIILGIVALVLIAIGIGVLIFWDKIFALFG